MKFRSVHDASPAVSFHDALMAGLAPDGGLYVPESFPLLPEDQTSSAKTLRDVGVRVLSSFIEEIPEQHLAKLLEAAWDFPIPVTRLEDGIYLLELFHGPTHAFKDVGARFMAHAMSHFLQQQERRLTIIVATSGDTGSAVAHGFFNVPNIDVFILYPSGKISRLQEQQMTTLGGNITAVEVEGNFDDCQRMVKATLCDASIQQTRQVTTANSINLGRLLPQIVYYFWGLNTLRVEFGVEKPPLVVVPSGNFGNLTAAAYAKRLGAGVRNFVAATNANDGVLHYLHSGTFVPRPSIPTYSNAMDVGNPSNLARLQSLYAGNVDALRKDIDAVSISNEETIAEIRGAYARTKVVLDPHTAVGVAAARQARSWMTNAPPILVASTAHPAKFLDVVAKAVDVKVAMPPSLQRASTLPKHSIKIRSRYSEWKELLLRAW